jgi:hypothetical protein
MFDDGGEIPIEHPAQTAPIACVLRQGVRHAARYDHRPTGDPPDVSQHHVLRNLLYSSIVSIGYEAVDRAAS